MKYLLSITTIALLTIPANAATPEKLDSAAKKIVGAWKLDFTAPDEVKRTPTIIIGRQHQELVAWYVESGQLEEFKEVQLKDDALLLTIRPRERRDVTVTFEAQLKNDGTCFGKGTFVSDSGDTGTWDFQGTRTPTSAFDDAETWSLSFVTPDDQQREAVVTVLSKNEKLYGWYSSKDYELPATKVTKEGDNVVMTIKTKAPNGKKVQVTFRGAVTGDRVTGEAEYDLEGETGSFQFHGERKS